MSDIQVWTCTLCGCRTLAIPHHLRLFGCRPETTMPTIGPWNPKLIARFWSHVDWSGDCWLWTATAGSHGYGNFVFRKGQNVLAHRFAAQAYLPDFDPALDVCHGCDVKRCVRPSHLWMGTASDNLRDAANKGRLNGQDRNTCIKGHPFDFVDSDGRRRCRTCAREKSRAYSAKRRAVEKALNPPTPLSDDPKAVYWREYRAKRKAEGRPLKGGSHGG